MPATAWRAGLAEGGPWAISLPVFLVASVSVPNPAV